MVDNIFTLFIAHIMSPKNSFVVLTEFLAVG